MADPTRFMPDFKTAGAARRFVRGYCVPRVVAHLPWRRHRPFVICAPATAARNGWRVLS